MLSWVVLNFILVIYSNVTQLTYCLIGLLAMTRRVIWIRSVHPSVQTFSWNCLFSFFWNSTWCQGPMWCCVWQSQIFWKSCFALEMGKIGQDQGSFSFFLSSLFFINFVYNENLYYCNSCMLQQISYLGKFWFLRYGPKCSWPIILQDFSINHRTLKLAVSYKEINELNCFLVCSRATVFSGIAH